ncbi:MAG TPA: DUF4126 domain-containing protein [Caulobacteraceae bacterium]|nr:DUF4126 domain-containing protein [Caulobacteraceae bacterium]
MIDPASMAFVSTLLALPVAFTIDPAAPLLVFGLALRAGAIHDPILAGPQFAGFASDGFTAAAAVFYFLHAAADKIPLCAHLFDALGLIGKPLAVALLGFWVQGKLGPAAPLHWIALAAILAGGVPATLALQTLRAKVRLGASVASLGTLHPMISTMDNVAGAGLSWLAFTHPGAALAVIAPAAVVLWLAMRGLVRLARRGAGRMVSPARRNPLP